MDCAPVIGAAPASAARPATTSRAGRPAGEFDNLLGDLSEDRSAADAPAEGERASRPDRIAPRGAPRKAPAEGARQASSAPEPAADSPAGDRPEPPSSTGPETDSAPSDAADDPLAAAAPDPVLIGALPVDLMLSVPASGIRFPDAAAVAPTASGAEHSVTGNGAAMQVDPAPAQPGAAAALPLIAAPPRAVDGVEQAAPAAEPLGTLLENVPVDPGTSSGLDTQGIDRRGTAAGLDTTASAMPEALATLPAEGVPAAERRTNAVADRRPFGRASEAARRLVAAALTIDAPADGNVQAPSAAAAARVAGGTDGNTPNAAGSLGPAQGTVLRESAAARTPAASGRTVADASQAAPLPDTETLAGSEVAGQRTLASRAMAAVPEAQTPVRESQSADGRGAVAAVAGPVFLDGSGLQPAASVGQSAATVAAPPAADDEMSRQVVRAITLAWRDEVGEARLRLTPEHLGEVTVSLRVERGVVSAVLQAGTAAARDWIRQHESDLRAGLEGLGLQLDALVVTDEGSSRGQQEPEQPPRPRRQAARRSANAPIFEVNA